MEEKWQEEWQPMIDAVGKDFCNGFIWGADKVEEGTIRRFLEPLEFDCPLHYDKTVAQQSGYDDIISPFSALLTWAIPPAWEPGMKIFTSEKKNAQPTYSPITGTTTDLAPKTTGFFATNMEMDFLKPVYPGDRIGRVGNVLLACTPKETRVGRGAFTDWESRLENQNGKVVAKVRTSMYHYNPHSN